MAEKLLLLVWLSAAVSSFCPAALAQTTFTNVAKEAGLGNARTQGSAPVWGDYDNDGDLDLYIAYSDWGWWTMGPDVFYRNNGDGTFTDVTEKAGLGENDGACSHAGFLDYDNDGHLDLYVYNPTWNGAFDNRVLLYHNDGDGTFTDVSGENGITKLGDRLSWSGGFADYDNDGDLDIYIGVWLKPNFFYENNGDGTFTDATAKAGLGDVYNSINIASGDYDNDGDMDIYVSNGGNQVTTPDVLYRNNGDGTSTDVAEEAGVGEDRNGRGVAFFDYDNDGDLDILLGGATRLYRNNGNSTFTDVAAEAGVLPPIGPSRLTAGDYDNDGYIDIFLLLWSRPGMLYHNNGDGTFTNVAKETGVSVSAKAGACAFATMIMMVT